MDHEDLLLMLPKIKLFTERMEENWTSDVASAAHTTLGETKWKAPKRLPLAADVRQLHTYLLERQEVTKAALEKESTPENFRSFCEVILCRVLLFNRRRVGETQGALRVDYEKSNNCPPPEDVDIMEGRSALEQVLVKWKCAGKRGG